MKDLFNKISDNMAEKKEAMIDALDANLSFAKFSEKFTGMTEGAKQKSIDFMNDLLALPPIIDKIGFNTTEIAISIGLPPDVTFEFEKTEDVSTEEREQILEQHKDKAMLGTIVKTLLLAESYQQKLKMGNFRFTKIQVCVGLTGGVSFLLVPKG